MDPLNVLAKFEIRRFSRSWDNSTRKNWAVPPCMRPRSLFSKIFNGLLFGWTLWMYRPNLKFIALPLPEIIATGVLGGVRTPILGRGDRRGYVMVPFGRALMSSYRLPVVTFPLSLNEILPLLCSRTPFFPTPPLVSPKFPHVPLGLGGWPLGSEERWCWANCSCS